MKSTISLTILYFLLPLSQAFPLDQSSLSRRSAQEDDGPPLPVPEPVDDSDLRMLESIGTESLNGGSLLDEIIGEIFSDVETTVKIDKRFISTPTRVHREAYPSKDQELAKDDTSSERRAAQDDDSPPGPSSSAWPPPPEVPDDDPSPFSKRSLSSPSKEHPEQELPPGTPLKYRRAAQGGEQPLPDEIIELAAAFEKATSLARRAAQGDADEDTKPLLTRRFAHGPGDDDDGPPMPPMPPAKVLKRRLAQDPPTGDEDGQNLFPIVRRAAQDPDTPEPTSDPDIV